MEGAIATLVSRLETVTARLESVEKQLQSGSPAPASNTSSSTTASSSASVTDYEDLIGQFITPYVEHSKKIDPVVANQAELVLKAVHSQRDFLKVAAACKKPADDALSKLIKPTSDLMGEISKIKDTNRTSKFFNNLSAVSEGIAALGWVVVAPTPGPHVADMRGGSEFYSNRILKDFKGKDQNQVDWVAGFNGFLKELQNYIKKHHTTGVSWNARGGDAASFSVGSSASDDTSSGAPPPPGPPPPGPPPPAMDTSSSANAPDMNQVFASLNKGEDITKALKKVTSEMKTKNRTDKVAVVPAAAIKSAEEKPSKKAAAAPAKPPKFALEGTKWVVEHQLKNKEIVIQDAEVKQTVYIYKCKDSVIQIKGKVNAVTVDDCTKCGIVFDNVVASFEVVNCNSLEVQVVGKVPCIAVDKTSGCQIFLSKESLDTEIVTSKTSEMNVSFPGATPDSDLTETPVPEQFKSYVKNGKLISEIVYHKG
jgi:adenylyl cyclase-associated protein